MISVKHNLVLMDGGGKRLGQNQGMRRSSSM